MAVLRIKVSGKISMIYDPINLTFLRNISETKATLLNYSNATGQTVVTGQILHSIGTVGTVGYLVVKSTSDALLSGSGSIPISVTHFPSETQATQTVSFSFNGNIDMTLYYSSNPVSSNIELLIENASTYAFKSEDFTTKYTDFDGDALTEIAISGNVSNLMYDGSPYISGAWIPISLVSNLIYTAINQNEYYELDLTWKAKDSSGNISQN